LLGSIRRIRKQRAPRFWLHQSHPSTKGHHHQFWFKAILRKPFELQSLSVSLTLGIVVAMSGIFEDGGVLMHKGMYDALFPEAAATFGEFGERARSYLARSRLPDEALP